MNVSEYHSTGNHPLILKPIFYRLSNKTKSKGISFFSLDIKTETVMYDFLRGCVCLSFFITAIIKKNDNSVYYIRAGNRKKIDYGIKAKGLCTSLY